jgi:uncharacterized membrane protein
MTPALVIICEVYPVLVGLALNYGYHSAAALLCGAVVALRATQVLHARHAKWWITILAALTLFSLFGAISASVSTAPLFLPFVINVSLFAVFAFSLATPRNVIEQIARLQEPELPLEGVRYCRRVCQLWMLFFLVNGAISLDSVFRSLEWWSLYNGCISYALVGVFFTTEYLCRRAVKRRVAQARLRNLAGEIIVVALLVLSSVIRSAYASPASTEQPRPASIETYLKPPGPFKAPFREQRFVSVLSAPLEASGEVLCIPSQGLIWSTTRPFQKSTYLTPSGIEHRDQSGAIVSDSERSEVSQTLLALLSGDVKTVSENFTVTLLGRDDAWTVTLVPNDPLVVQVISQIAIRGAKHPEVVEVSHASGDRIVMTFESPILLTPQEISHAEGLLHVGS